MGGRRYRRLDNPAPLAQHRAAVRDRAPVSISTRFLDSDTLRRGVAGCPLAAPRARRDRTACRACAYNLLYPGEPEVGCAASTPVEVFERASDGLRRRDPALAGELELLRRDAPANGEDAARAARWIALAEAWYACLGDVAEAAAHSEEEEEVAMIAARFARAALSDGLRVEILR